MSDPKKEGPSPGKIFATMAAVGIGLVVLAVGAESLYNMARAISMSFDLLTKPILLLLVIGGIATMIFTGGKKGGGHDDHAAPKKEEKPH